jgi:rhodanese-related sulfurtransferase
MREIAASDLAKLLDEQASDVLILDVREPWENKLAALPGSRLLPLAELPQRVNEIGVPKDRTVVTYCHHGVRSQTAAAWLERAGFRNVVSLAGGIDAWSVHIDPSVRRY